PHRLVAEYVTRLEERAEHAVQVQVRTADRGRGDPDDDVVRLLDRRIRDVGDFHVLSPLPGQCPHACSFRAGREPAARPGYPASSRAIRRPARRPPQPPGRRSPTRPRAFPWPTRAPHPARTRPHPAHTGPPPGPFPFMTNGH